MCRAIKGGELAKSFEQWLVHTVNTFKNRSTFQTNIHSICESTFTTDKVAKETKICNSKFNFVKQEKYQTISC
jgi:hypothetical protein